MNIIDRIFFRPSSLLCLLLAAAPVSVMSLTGCTEEIKIEGAETVYDGLDGIYGKLADARTSASEAEISLWKDEMETEVSFLLNKNADMGVDVTIAYDSEYLAEYNETHGTSFSLYPEELVKISNDGKFLLAPDDRISDPLKISVSTGQQISSDVTYIIPLKVVSVTEGVTLEEGLDRVVYTVKDTRSGLSPYKGENAVKNVVFFELGDANPLNALEFRMSESGAMFFDYVVLFAGNINYSFAENRVYFSRNAEVQFLLDNVDEYIRPLQNAGIKVLMGVLGNHDDAGLSQLSERASRDFARELASYIYTYGLDGVCFDDEYSNTYPDVSNPLFVTPSAKAAARLVYETKKAMSDKTMMIYYSGYLTSLMPAVDGVEPGYFVDFVVDDYRAGAAEPMSGMSLGQCSGSSIELSKQQGSSEAGDDTEATARQMKAAGYGYYMYFSLNPDNYATLNQVNRCRNVAAGLYDESIARITHYYKKESTVRTAFNIPQ